MNNVIKLLVLLKNDVPKKDLTEPRSASLLNYFENDYDKIERIYHSNPQRIIDLYFNHPNQGDFTRKPYETYINIPKRLLIRFLRNYYQGVSPLKINKPKLGVKKFKLKNKFLKPKKQK